MNTFYNNSIVFDTKVKIVKVLDNFFGVREVDLKNDEKILHAFNLPGFFSTDHDLTSYLQEFRNLNFDTIYINYHPLQIVSGNLIRDLFDLNNSFEMQRFGSNKLIEICNFNVDKCSKSVRNKYKKYKNLIQINEISYETFLDCYKEYSAVSSKYPLLNDPIVANQCELHAFEITSAGANLKSWALFGIGGIENNRCAEYLAAFSKNTNSKDLQSVMIIESKKLLSDLGCEFINLGGGSYPNDSIETFKSWFDVMSVRSLRLKLILTENIYFENVRINKFPSECA